MVALLGADGSLSEVFWAQMNSFGNDVSVVRDPDLAPSVGPGIREAVTAAGWVRVCGCMAKLPAATVTLDQNGGTQDRKDFRVAEFNWGSTVSALGTPPNEVALQTFKGPASGALPDLSAFQTPGVLWREPIGLYTIPSGSGPTITLEDWRARRRLTKVLRGVMPTDVIIIGKDADWHNICSVPVPYPGWPYRLQFEGRANFAPVEAGFAVVQATVDGNTVDTGRAGAKNVSLAALAGDYSAVQTGSVTARFQFRAGSAMNESLTLSNTYGAFVVSIIPA